VRLAHAGDRRATFVRLTPKGAQRFQTMARAHEAWVDEILAGLSTADAEALIDLLGKLGRRKGVGPSRNVADGESHAGLST
jgi:DNA-binding MarR family transcriptional regulator